MSTHLFADVIRERLTESGLEAEALREDAVRLTQRADALEQFCELLYDALNRLPRSGSRESHRAVPRTARSRRIPRPGPRRLDTVGPSLTSPYGYRSRRHRQRVRLPERRTLAHPHRA